MAARQTGKGEALLLLAEGWEGGRGRGADKLMPNYMFQNCNGFCQTSVKPDSHFHLHNDTQTCRKVVSGALDNISW